MIMLMDCSPPIHGMSTINSIMQCSLLTSSAIKPVVINTVPSRFSKLFGTRLWMLIKLLYFPLYLFQLTILSIGRKHNVVYRPINGGIGQIFDLLYVLVCRLTGKTLFIHHHAFNYLNQYSFIFALLVKLSPNSTVHIVLGKKMQQKLIEQYNIKNTFIRVLSNAAFFNDKGKEEQTQTKAENSIVKIGHLSNLSLDKGIDVYMDICKILEKKSNLYEAFLAGPYSNEQAKIVVEEGVQQISKLKCFGAIYGLDKQKFFSNLDCFVLPSRNEAEPLVLYEAASYGVMLIGTKVGCVEDVISTLNGSVFSVDDNLGMNCANAIELSQQNHFFSTAQRELRLKAFEDLKQRAKHSLTNIIQEIIECETMPR